MGGVLAWYNLKLTISFDNNFVYVIDDDLFQPYLCVRDYLSPLDLIAAYPHLIVMGTGLAFGYLVVRYIYPIWFL